MQRVLSGQTSRCMESSQEFISKKLCISVVFVCAFFSLLGGFLMGRYAMERFNSSHDSNESEGCSKNLHQLAFTISKLNSLAQFISNNNSDVKFKTDVNYKLQCSESNVALPIFNSSTDFSLVTDSVIEVQLLNLQTCYNSVIDFIENVLYPTV